MWTVKKELETHPVQSGRASHGDDSMKGRIIQKLGRLVCEEHASALVEFAMTALALMGLLFGVLACGFALYAYHFTIYAADQGAAFAQLRGHTWSAGVSTPCATSAPPSFTMPYDCEASLTDIQNYVQSLVSGGISTSNLTISPTWPGTEEDGTTTDCTTNTNAQSCIVKVQVTYNFSLLPYPKQLSNMTFGATVQRVIVQ
jgi:Flp pilus assembly protein TadG